MAMNVILMTIGAAAVYMLTLTGWNGIVEIYPENLAGFYPTVEPLTMPIEAAKATIMLLSVILLVESTIVLSIRRINMPIQRSLRESGTIIYVFLLGLIYLAHYLLMYVPLVQEILSAYALDFYFVPLTRYDWFIVLLGSLPAIIGVEIYKWRFRRRDIDL